MKTLSSFTNLYSLSKTLRFELKPIDEKGQPIANISTVLKDILEKDKEIEDAYQALKPVLDGIYEQIINNSLNSDAAKSIDFKAYFDEYKKGKAKKLEDFEKILRADIGKTFEETINDFNRTFAKKKKKGEVKPLFEIKKNALKAKAELLDYLKEKHKDNSELQSHLIKIKSFWTYFSNYNTNRTNYFEYKKEASTAVATRIVSENLPKFCDNKLLFEKREQDYKNAYQFLKENNRETKIKDAESGEMIEAIAISTDLFAIAQFNKCLTQTEIGTYNKIIGHYNLLINLYNQARKDEKDFVKLKHFKTLYKQIGCGKGKALFFTINSDDELRDLLNTIQKNSQQFRTNVNGFTDWLQEHKQNNDWSGIYWSKAAVDRISNKYLENWHSLKDELKKNKTCVHKNSRTKEIEFNDAVELSGLFGANLELKEDFKGKNLIDLICEDIKANIDGFSNQIDLVLTITDYKTDENKMQIKKSLDFILNVIHLVKYFSVKENKVKGESIDPELSNHLSLLLRSEDFDIVKWHDAIRSYLTKKPQDDVKKQKLKLNFAYSVLLGGWSDGQEKIKGVVLLKKEKVYYLGILAKRNIFDTQNKNNSIYKVTESNAGRLILKNIAFKTVAGKGFVSKYGEKYSKTTEPIKKLKEFIKEKYVSKYPLLQNLLDKDYRDKKIFDKELQDVLSECYECEFSAIDWSKVLEYVEKKDLYLFEIYSKDFSTNKGVKSKNSNLNLQTLYWNQIFEKDSLIQLCGGGEIFFREIAIKEQDEKNIHRANKPIYRRSDEKTNSRFSHDIIKDKRFTQEKLQLHIPIKINYQKSNCITQTGDVIDIVSPKINTEWTKENDVLFLGIDRGEKNLIYYSLINQRGEIVDNGQGDFNVINGKDYYSEIVGKANEKKKAQKDWGEAVKIQDIKDGYISLVVHEIMQKIKGKPTFIVLESLNKGFKRSRISFEHQTYQKIETAIAKKLNYLVYKDAKNGEIGSAVNGLQLTPPIKNYEDIEKKSQLGIMLYVRANYTSTTDPVTGWRKTIYLQKGSEEKVKKQILSEFTEIGFDGQDYFFEYTEKNPNKQWKLWSGKNGKSLERYRFRRGKDKNEGIIESFDLKMMLDKLFTDFDKTTSLKKQLLTKNPAKINEHPAWESLRFIIDIIMQIRNNGDTAKNQDENFLLSPVRDELDKHFDSRNYQNKENPKLPKDADANGAFNIARKGLMAFEHIKQNSTEPDLFISDEEWDLWLLNRGEWKKRLPEFSTRKQKQTGGEEE